MNKVKRYGLLISGILIFILSFIVIGKNIETTKKVSPYIGEVTQWIDFKINECDLSINSYETNKYYDTVTLNSEVENSISVGTFEGYKIFINDEEVKSNSSINIHLDKLDKDTVIEIKLQDLSTNEERYHYINTLPSVYMDAMVISNNPEEGYYYFNVDDYVYKMSTQGEIVFWRLAGGGDISIGGTDFKRTEVNGKVFYSFLFGNESSDNYPYLSEVGYGRMQAMVLDEEYKIVEVVPFLIPNGEIEEQCALENHQFTILGDNHYLLSAYIGKRVNNIPEEIPHSSQGARVVANIIQEIKDGKVIFEWDSTDYPELYGLSVESNDYFNVTNLWADYAHFNSIVIDPRDDNFVCSFRNLSTVLKIDRKTGEILWKLGGKEDEFGLLPEQLFSHQHDVKVTENGALTLFNNGNEGNSSVKGQTNIMKFYLDEVNKQVVDWKVYETKGDFSPYMGSAQEIEEDHFVIGWGHRNTTLPLFSEIDFATNTVLFELVRPNSNLTGVSPHTYRVYKFDE